MDKSEPTAGIVQVFDANGVVEEVAYYLDGDLLGSGSPEDDGLLDAVMDEVLASADEDENEPPSFTVRTFVLPAGWESSVRPGQAAEGEILALRTGWPESLRTFLYLLQAVE